MSSSYNKQEIGGFGCGAIAAPGTEKLLHRPMQCNQALENRSYHSGVILKRAVEMNADQRPRIVKQGAANCFDFACPFLNLKFDVRIPWFYGHINLQ